MSLEILNTDVHLHDLTMRIPFQYGIATMTSAPQAFVRCEVRIGEERVSGIAADFLPPKWFTKDPQRDIADEVDEMLDVVEHAAQLAVGIGGETAFDVWRILHARQAAWGTEQEYPPLLWNFGVTLVERAVIEAVCKAAGKPFSAVVRSGGLGIDLGTLDERLTGANVADLLPPRPCRSVTSRQTVGLGDALREADITPADRVDDGLPQSLEALIARYGLKHFKIKVRCQGEDDIRRIADVAGVIAAAGLDDFAFSLDGNESCRTLEEFREFWNELTSNRSLQPFLARLLWVEQPFHRDVALDTDEFAPLAAWEARPPLIIDESDSSYESLPQALALGYAGTSHKNCKGVFHGIAHACLLEHLRRSDPAGTYILSGEDLANVGPVALLQDLAVVANLGAASVERNGHHYVAGLSAYPEGVQEQVLAAHPDLYAATARGWPSLTITNGEIALDSVLAAPLGVGFDLDVEQFVPADEWKHRRTNP